MGEPDRNISTDLRHLQGVKDKKPEDKGRFLPAAFSPSLRASYTERAVLAWLASRERSGEVWEQLDEAAACTGLALRSVRRILHRLADPAREGGAVIERETRHRGALGPSGWHLSRSTAVVRLVGLVGLVVAPLIRVDIRRWFRPDTAAELSTLHRVLLALVASHANEAGWSWPSYARLAWLAGCSVRAVGAAVAQLCHAGQLVRQLVAPGAELPDGTIAREWRVKLQIQPDTRAATAGHTCRDSRTHVPKSPLHGSDLDRTPAAPPPPDPVAEVLRGFSSVCSTDRLGADAPAVIRARFDEGRTVAELLQAARGVASVPWRMELCERRTLRACFGTPDKLAGFMERGAKLAPDAYMDPIVERLEALQRAAERVEVAKGQAALLRVARATPGGLAALIRRG